MLCFVKFVVCLLVETVTLQSSFYRNDVIYYVLSLAGVQQALPGFHDIRILSSKLVWSLDNMLYACIIYLTLVSSKCPWPFVGCSTALC